MIKTISYTVFDAMMFMIEASYSVGVLYGKYSVFGVYADPYNVGSDASRRANDPDQNPLAGPAPLGQQAD